MCSARHFCRCLRARPGASCRKIQQNCIAGFIRWYRANFLVATVWTLIANLLAGSAFLLLFGQAWTDAVPYLRAVSVFYLLQAVLHPISTTLQILERQVTAVAWQVGRVLVVVPGVLLPWWSGMSALTALWISAVIQAACCLVLLWLMVSAIREAIVRHCVADQ